MVTRTLIALLLLALTLPESPAQSLATALQPQLQSWLDSVVIASSYPGATLAVTLPSGARISLASGYADKEANRPMQPGSSMLGGSTGKTFVAALLLHHAFEHDLDLDTPLSRWLGSEPWFDRLPNAKDLTPRMLLNHSSGLPRYVFDPGFIEALQKDPWKEWQAAEELAFVLDQAAVHPAGNGWAYSDTNYLLLGLLLEQWTGTAYYDLLQRVWLTPLSLHTTRPSDTPDLPTLCPGYVGEANPLGLPAKVGEGGRYPLNPQFEWTGGGLLTTAVDLSAWLWLLHRGELLPPEAYAAMYQPIDLQTGKSAAEGYGLGTFVWQTPYGRHLGHSGFFPGYLTIAEYNTRQGFSMAMQVNTDQGLGRNHHSLMLEVTALIANEMKRQMARDKQAIRLNFRRQAACWNRGDLTCFMESYHATDSLRMVSSSGVKQGYQDILQRYIDTYPPEKMGQLSFDLLHWTPLRPDLYHIIGRYNLRDEEGKRSGFFSVLMQRIEGRWLMVADHSSSSS